MHHECRMVLAVSVLAAAALAASPLDGVRSLADAGRLAEALVLLDSITARTEDPEVRFEAGKLLRELAQRRFADLQRVAPGSAPVHELAGRHLELQGKLAESLAEYRAAQAREPNRPGLRYRTGNVLWGMKEYEKAETELRAELAANPAHGMANLRLGQLLAARNDDAAAVPFLERAVQSLPSSLEAHRDLGKSYRKVGRTADARSQWELVARARPQDDQVHFLLGSLLRETGDAAGARRELELHRAILERRRALSEKR